MPLRKAWAEPYSKWLRRRMKKEGINFDKMPDWEKRMVRKANRIDYNIEQSILKMNEEKRGK